MAHNGERPRILRYILETVTAAQLEEQERRLTQLYQEGYVAFEEFQRRWEDLQARRAALRPPPVPAVLEIGAILARGVGALWSHPDADPQARRKLALAVFEQIVIDGTSSRDLTIVKVDWRPEVLPLLEL